MFLLIFFSVVLKENEREKGRERESSICNNWSSARTKPRVCVTHSGSPSRKAETQVLELSPLSLRVLTRGKLESVAELL